MTNQIDFFISYSIIDIEWVRQFIENIEAHAIWDEKSYRKISVFHDQRDICPGTSILNRLVEKIKAARIFLLVMSPDCFRSEWTSRECGIALDNKKKIVPLYLRDSDIHGDPLQNLAFGFKEISFIDFRDQSKFPEQVERVVDLLNDIPLSTNFISNHIAEIFNHFQTAFMIPESVPVRTASAPKDPFSGTLETAAPSVMERICWVVAPPSKLIGCAWGWKDNLLLCHEAIGRHIEKFRANGSAVNIRKADPDQIYNEIIEVTDSDQGPLSILRVRPDCWMPDLIHMEWESTRHWQKPIQVGAITYQKGPGPGGLKPGLSFFSIGENGALQRLDQQGYIAPGTPLFDPTPRLLGMIVTDSNRKLAFQSFTEITITKGR